MYACMYPVVCARVHACRPACRYVRKCRTHTIGKQRLHTNASFLELKPRTSEARPCKRGYGRAPKPPSTALLV